MNNTTIGLNNAFGISSDLEMETTEIEREFQGEIVLECKTTDLENDYNETRNNIKEIIAQGTDALTELVSLAKTMQHPDAFKALAALTKSLVDANQSILDVQKKMKVLREGSPSQQASLPLPGGGTHPATVLLELTTTDLQKLRRGGSENKNPTGQLLDDED